MSTSSFVDETFQLSNKQNYQTFYVLACLSIRNEHLASTRHELQKIVGDHVWHSTDEIKTENGRTKLLEICNLITSVSKPEIYLHSPISPLDKLGEAARAKLIRQIFTELKTQLSEPNSSFIYERRLSGYQSNADTRTINELRKFGLILGNPDIRARTKIEDPLLWLADSLATGFRQSFVWGKDTYLDVLKPTIKAF